MMASPAGAPGPLGSAAGGGNGVLERMWDPVQTLYLGMNFGLKPTRYMTI
jgi:hypothetical protein